MSHFENVNDFRGLEHRLSSRALWARAGELNFAPGALQTVEAARSKSEIGVNQGLIPSAQNEGSFTVSHFETAG